MTNPTDTEKLAQALRNLLASEWATPEYNAAVMGAIAVLEAHESRAQPEVKPVYVLDRYGFPVGASQYRLVRMADGYWTPWHIAQQTISQTIARMQYEFDKALESQPRAQPIAMHRCCDVSGWRRGPNGETIWTIVPRTPGVPTFEVVKYEPPAQPASVAGEYRQIGWVHPVYLDQQIDDGALAIEVSQPRLSDAQVPAFVRAAAPQQAKESE